jgi:oligoendopeptidase F
MRRARGSAERPTIAATLSVVLVACAAATPMRLTALAFLAAAPLRLASARAAANAAAAPGVCAAAAGARCAAPPTMAAAAAPAAITGPAWDLGDEYASLSAPELAADLAAAKEDVKAMAGAGAVVAGALERARDMSLEEVEAEGVLAALEEMNRLGWSAGTLLRNVATFASCVGSVDGGNEAAKRLGAEMGELFAARAQAAAPADLFLQLCPGEVAEAYLGRSAETGENRFLVGERRKMRAHALSLAEENMLSAYAVPGHHAWGDLYTDLSASLAVKVEGTGSMGVAAAAGLLDSGDAAVRRAAWLGIKAAWLPHAETSAAILNALAKWRLDTYARRGLPDFLAAPLHQNRLTRPSLDAMMAAIDGEGVRVGRRALAVQAAALGRADGKLEPWDLMAPAPVAGRGTTYPFEDGVEVIAAAVGAVDVKAGEFVRMMRDKRWIEATRGDSKRPGAYCTGFAKSRNPRVYLSEYNGRAPLLLTLAHELGHAYHSWVMRDLPRAQTSYPMCLGATRPGPSRSCPRALSVPP